MAEWGSASQSGISLNHSLEYLSPRNVRLPIPPSPPPISGSVHAKLGVSECAPQYQEKKNYAVVSFHFMIISDFYNI